MSFTQLLRQSRASRTSVLHKFLTQYDPNTPRIYAFVEGDPDKAFYRSHLQRYTSRSADIHVYNCAGKKNVYSAYDSVIKRYPSCPRVLFFVDKDIDDLIGVVWSADPRIFVTEYYSIENYIVCQDALVTYLDSFVKIRHVEISLDSLLAEFHSRLSEFHRMILPVMAWIAVMRRSGHHVTLKDIDLGKLFAVSDSGLRRVPQRQMLSYLARVTGVSVPRGIWRNVRAACVEMRRLPPKSYVRGKFEAWWFIEFSKRMTEGIQKVAKEADGSTSFTAQLSESTYIQLLTNGVGATNTLQTFLSFHLQSPRSPTPSQSGTLSKGLVEKLRNMFR